MVTYGQQRDLGSKWGGEMRLLYKSRTFLREGSLEKIPPTSVSL